MRLLYVGIALVLRNLWVWLHYAVLAMPRQGGRVIVLERLRWETLLLWLLHVAEETFGVADSHHAPYPDDVLATLPFSRMTSPSPVIAAVYQAGWRAVRIARLHDVEWARRLQTPWPLGWLEHVPRFAVTADAAPSSDGAR